MGSIDALTSGTPHIQISLFEIARPVHQDQESVEITPLYPRDIQTALQELQTKPVVVFGDRSGLSPPRKRSRKRRKALVDHEQVSLFDHER